jgi:hypothetical protein
MDHLTTLSHTDGQVEPRVEFAPEAFTSRFATDAVHGDETTTEEGLLVEQFSELRAGETLAAWQMATNSHEESPPYADILKYIRKYYPSQPFSQCEFAF